MAIVIVVILRLVIPLVILKKPFWGMVIAVFLDAADMELSKFLGSLLDKNFIIDFAGYHLRDKILDLYMSSLALYASFSWKEILAQRTSLILYLWRLVGVVLFEITKIHIYLVIFPNLFEFFFLFYAYTQQYRASFRIQNLKRLSVILFLLLVPKLAQEYFQHILHSAPWAYFKHDVLGWPKTPAEF